MMVVEDSKVCRGVLRLLCRGRVAGGENVSTGVRVSKGDDVQTYERADARRFLS